MSKKLKDISNLFFCRSWIKKSKRNIYRM